MEIKIRWFWLVVASMMLVLAYLCLSLLLFWATDSGARRNAFLYNQPLAGKIFIVFALLSLVSVFFTKREAKRVALYSAFAFLALFVAASALSQVFR
ncbi:MAG: hypothetical protein MUD10_03410 [Candidatus Pacebacteria bacterium]|jgi:hypothetical protein|nr:hypothetical protein [Candidatus Paceibacterota bacterium]